MVDGRDGSGWEAAIGTQQRLIDRPDCTGCVDPEVCFTSWHRDLLSKAGMPLMHLRRSWGVGDLPSCSSLGTLAFFTGFYPPGRKAIKIGKIVKHLVRGSATSYETLPAFPI